jgi:hypothetical protein
MAEKKNELEDSGEGKVSSPTRVLRLYARRYVRDKERRHGLTRTDPREGCHGNRRGRVDVYTTRWRIALYVKYGAVYNEKTMNS